jgi:hypothetical protein
MIPNLRSLRLRGPPAPSPAAPLPQAIWGQHDSTHPGSNLATLNRDSFSTGSCALESAIAL